MHRTQNPLPRGEGTPVGDQVAVPVQALGDEVRVHVADGDDRLFAIQKRSCIGGQGQTRAGLALDPVHETRTHRCPVFTRRDADGGRRFAARDNGRAQVQGAHCLDPVPPVLRQGVTLPDLLRVKNRQRDIVHEVVAGPEVHGVQVQRDVGIPRGGLTNRREAHPVSADLGRQPSIEDCSTGHEGELKGHRIRVIPGQAARPDRRPVGPPLLNG